MNADRAAAYGRVVRTIEDVGPAKLHAHEISRVREAADTLLFATGGEASATAALLDMVALTNGLRDAERWTEDAAETLLADVAGCGPAAVAVARRAAVYA
jgi:hypothetical protein